MNPFLSGSPVKGEQFADRVTELDYLTRRMLNGQNVILMSPRRYGKTSLLIRAAGDVRGEGGRVAMANLFMSQTRREVAEELTRAVVGGALGWLEGTVQQVRERLARLPWVTPTLEHDGWKLSIERGRAQATFGEEIRRPIALLAEAGGKGHPVAVVIDEFQQIEQIDKGLSGVFKAMADDLSGLSMVFAGSRRHLMERLFVGAGAPLMGIGEILNLDVIPLEEMTDFLTGRSAEAGKPMTQEAAEEIYRLMRGIPHFVQLLAANAFERPEEEITLTVVHEALVDVLARQNGELALRFESMNPTHRKLVRALARQPVRDLYSKQFLDAVELPQSSLQRAKKALQEGEQITFDAQIGWRLSDPIFERWVRHPLELDLGEELSYEALS
jgi:AAA+ ATPase superfamily predicted ATPase